MKEVLKAITHLGQQDFFYLADRRKSFFDYPLHCHDDFELNFLEGAAGAIRVVGDSREVVTDTDLVLVGGEQLPHVWEQGTCAEHEVHEITIHINANVLSILSSAGCEHHYFSPIVRLLDRAKLGLAFTPTNEVREALLQLAKQDDDFQAMLQLLWVLHLLASDKQARQLTTAFTPIPGTLKEDLRIVKVRDYIAAHYHEYISMRKLANLANMTTESFSRFFHKKTGRTPIRFLIEYRMGIAARQLRTTTSSISEIAYGCGFNTMSHFNRLFLEIRGCTPTEFRDRF